MDASMTRTTLLLSAALVVLATAPAWAQVTSGGAGNTGVRAPATTGGVPAGNPRAVRGTVPGDAAAAQGNATVTGTTPGTNIGGTPTSGPPGTGGTAGGPALGNR
jgi:hypothetical protein